MVRYLVLLALFIAVGLLAWFFTPYADNKPLALGIALMAGGMASLFVGFIWWSIERAGFALFLSRAIETVLIVMVMFTCLAFGGTTRWSWAVIEGLAALAVMLWALRMILERRIAWAKTPLNVLVLLLVL